MHRAPAVTFSVKRSRWQLRGVACLSLLALVCLAVFVQGQPEPDARSGVLALTMCVTSGLALLGWKHAPSGSLRWDGQYWHWSGFAADPACRVGLRMDFQRVVVVCITAASCAPVILWLEAANPGDPNWRALRRALVSSQARPGKVVPSTGLDGEPA